MGGKGGGGCSKSLKKDVKEGSDRKVRGKGPGRVKEIVITLEEGAKQCNKISSYFSKFGEERKNLERGHPLANKTCVSGGGIKRVHADEYGSVGVRNRSKIFQKGEQKN